MMFQVFLKAIVGMALLVGFSTVSCQQESTGESPSQPVVPSGDSVSGQGMSQPVVEGMYDLANPAATHPLPDELKEISSVAALSETRLVVNEDNRGKVYVLDSRTGAVQSEVEFGKKGDFEEVEPVGSNLYVLRSDGRLFVLPQGWESAAAQVQVSEHKLDLPKGCDAEGLAYQPGPNRLLISCKEDPGKGIEDARAIYAYDPEKGAVDEEAQYIIPFSDLAKAAGISEKEARDFKPSGMAIHPVTGDLYVISSVLKVIVVLGSSGEIRRVDKLDGSLLEQPEGICFLPGGDMMISSEGQKRPAVLVLYTNNG